MKFIKLTRIDKWNEGKPVYINTNCIVAVFEFEENETRQTGVTTNDADGGYFDVRESPEEIMAMIEER